MSIREFIRRLVTIALFLFVLFHLLLWTLPYTGYPAYWIAMAASGNPIIAILLSSLALSGLFLLIRNLGNVFDAGMYSIRRVVCLVI